jgi:nitrogen fixation protein FixH
VFLGGIQLVLVRMALHDPSFSIEDGYYAKATSWDARRAQDAQNARLGWQLNVGFSVLPRGEIEVVLATPTDASGATLTGLHVDVEAFAVARSSARIRATLIEGPPGEYRAPLRTLRSGLWELSFTAKKGPDVFTHTRRVDLPGEGSR